MAKFIMTGPWHALGFVVLTTLLSIVVPLVGLVFGVMGNAAVGLVTLRLGWQQGLKIALGATAMISLLIASLYSASINTPLVLGGLWLTIIIIASLLTHTASWRQALFSVFGLVGLGLVLFHGLVPDTTSFWKHLFQPILQLKSLPQPLSAEQWNSLLDQAAPYLAGVFSVSLALILSLSLMLARQWQAQLYNPGGFSREFSELRLGKPAALVLLSLIGLTLLSSTPVLINVLLLGLLLFSLQGIAMMHGSIRISHLPKTWLLALYLPFLFVPVHMILLLAAFGLVDSFADFRHYLAQKNQLKP